MITPMITTVAIRQTWASIRVAAGFAGAIGTFLKFVVPKV
jgi:hypothetical protein